MDTSENYKTTIRSDTPLPTVPLMMKWICTVIRTPYPIHFLFSPTILRLSRTSIAEQIKNTTRMSYQIAYDTARAPPRGAALVAFMEDFYRTSDTESLHEKYVQYFTEDATLIMGPKEAKGASGTNTPLNLYEAHLHIPTHRA